ncbi:MAG: ATP-grasp domain-containing protein [Candidatus Rokubacteria bacterium]|nr:ATP-grasp domain-containing protein [Candidatus Rokubacteria bacterium]MBI3104927.1 ATP-grasp domain-containing protein [Candidatus Rokubacteria bacterium]
MDSSPNRSPTVAITGLAASDNPGPGVAVARCLREARGPRQTLVGLAFDHRFTGLYATDLIDEVFLIPAPAYGDRSFVQALADVRRQTPIDVLIPALDPDVGLCAGTRRSLAGLGIHTLVPDAAAIRRRAKSVLSPLAEASGFAAPRTVTLLSQTAMTAALRDLALPFFLKGSFADARLVSTAEQAHAEFERLVGQWGFPLLAQERVIGDELNVTVLFNRKSELVGAVPMRKLGVTDRGKGWAGVTVRLPEVVERAGHLLRSIDWVGPAELEMIRDPASNRFYLIEINPRFPAWTYLTAAAGQNLPWAAVQLAMGREVRPFREVRPGQLFVRSVEDAFHPFDRVEALTSSRHVVLRGR